MNHKKNILWYSAMAASYLFVHGDVKADAIYVDIEPDITLDNGGESTVIC